MLLSDPGFLSFPDKIAPGNSLSADRGMFEEIQAIAPAPVPTHESQ